MGHDQPSLLGVVCVSELTPTPEWIAHTWNELMPAPIAKVRLPLSPKRRAQLAMRIREHPDIETWLSGLRQIAASDLCRGMIATPKYPCGWVVSFSNQICDRRDFILKAAEGAYQNRPIHLSGVERREFGKFYRATGGYCSHQPACVDRTAHRDRLMRAWLFGQGSGGGKSDEC